MIWSYWPFCYLEDNVVAHKKIFISLGGNISKHRKCNGPVKETECRNSSWILWSLGLEDASKQFDDDERTALYTCCHVTHGSIFAEYGYTTNAILVQCIKTETYLKEKG